MAEDSLYPFSVTLGQIYDGPLDLLLDLIRKQDLNIWDIPIARITAQFLSYVEQLKEADVDNAGEFIYTAALLIQIKSKMLLPKAPPEAGEANEPEDPRTELVERLLQHERFKNAAAMLAERQQIEAATWTRSGLKDFLNETAQADPENAIDPKAREIAADVPDLIRTFQGVLERARNRPVLDLEEDAVSVGKMIHYLRRRLVLEDRPIALSRILQNTRSERSLIAMFLALLELVRLQAILLRQDANFTEVFIKKQDGFEDVLEQRMKDVRDDWS